MLLGGCLSTAWLIAAYRLGIFPWPMLDDRGRMLLAWFCPDPRAVIPLEQFHSPRRLLRRVRRGQFQFTVNRAFSQVIRSCADREKDAGTWITPEIIEAYERLHQLGVALSVEVWQANELVGGVYGVAAGRCFSAESMFHRQTDASKAALYFLAQHLRQRDFVLLDVQIWSAHLAQFGTRQMPRDQFLAAWQNSSG